MKKYLFLAMAIALLPFAAAFAQGQPELLSDEGPFSQGDGQDSFVEEQIDDDDDDATDDDFFLEDILEFIGGITLIAILAIIAFWAYKQGYFSQAESNSGNKKSTKKKK